MLIDGVDGGIAQVDALEQMQRDLYAHETAAIRLRVAIAQERAARRRAEYVSGWMLMPNDTGRDIVRLVQPWGKEA
jgi:hypothetical protein